MSIPAQMDRRGFVRVAPLLRWQDVDVPEVVRRVLPAPMPVLVENDANAFAIGATYGRNEAPSGVTLFIVLESGVGGGIAIDGAMFRGAHGLAGEIGHLLVPDGLGGCARSRTSSGSRRCCRLTGPGRASPSSSAASGIASPVPSPSPRAGRERWPMRWCRSAASSIRTGSFSAARWRRSIRWLRRGWTPISAATQEASFPVPVIGVDEAERGSAFGAACMLHQRYLSLEGQRAGDQSLPEREVALEPGERDRARP